MRRPLLACVAAAMPALAMAQANNCDEIRTRIESKVRASGVADFRLLVVEKEAKVAGKVVGSCDLGRRQIVYVARAVSAPRGSEPILTECRDGTVTMGGDCKP